MSPLSFVPPLASACLVCVCKRPCHHHGGLFCEAQTSLWFAPAAALARPWRGFNVAVVVAEDLACALPLPCVALPFSPARSEEWVSSNSRCFVGWCQRRLSVAPYPSSRTGTGSGKSGADNAAATPCKPGRSLEPRHRTSRPPPCVTFRRVVAPLWGPRQSPVLPFACCVGLLLSVGRCGWCSCWCRFRIHGAQ